MNIEYQKYRELVQWGIKEGLVTPAVPCLLKPSTIKRQIYAQRDKEAEAAKVALEMYNAALAKIKAEQK